MVTLTEFVKEKHTHSAQQAKKLPYYQEKWNVDSLKPKKKKPTKKPQQTWVQWLCSHSTWEVENSKQAGYSDKPKVQSRDSEKTLSQHDFFLLT